MALTITGSGLTLDDVAAVARRREPVVLSDAARAKVDASWRRVTEWAERRRPIYGVNTGFGQMAHVAIPPADGRLLQVNLLRGHATSTGAELPEEVVRAILLARINTLAKGHSGIAPATLDLLVALLNEGIHPVVYQQGSLGASGDLAPLSHLALPLIGEGMVRFRRERMPAGRALEMVGLTPVVLGYKEGLALINGTSAMTGTLAIALIDALSLLDVEVALTGLFVEALQGSTGAFAPEGHALKEHPGQRRVAAEILRRLRDSTLTSEHAELMDRIEDLVAASDDPEPTGVFIQNAYTLRCVPQILGPVLEALLSSVAVVERELNSCNDNPLIFDEPEQTFHGGHFHGQYVAMAADFAAIALTEVGVLAERQLNRLLDPATNGDLGDFLALTEHGLSMGLMGAQYLATSIASENLDLASPSSVKSIPSNGQNQDVVSMGLNAARRVATLVVNVRRILAVFALACRQAAAIRGIDRFSPEGAAVLAAAGRFGPAYDESQPVGVIVAAYDAWLAGVRSEGRVAPDWMTAS